MEIQNLIDLIQAEPGCLLLPPKGQPRLESSQHAVPDDLVYFYERCGGADLFMAHDFGFRVVPPDELKTSNPLLKRFDYGARKDIFDSDVSAAWYLLFTSAGPEENIVIDLHPDRKGMCYDGYLNTYASSDCMIVAQSFTEALQGVVNCRGEALFWSGRDPIGHIYEILGVEPPCG